MQNHHLQFGWLKFVQKAKRILSIRKDSEKIPKGESPQSLPGRPFARHALSNHPGPAQHFAVL